MAQPRRVVQLIQGLAVGGLERVVVDLCRGLDRDRFAPVVCCYDALGPMTEPLSAADVPTVLEPRRPGKDWRYPARLARCLRRLGADVLHAHNQTAFFYGVLAAKLAGVGRIVYTEHDRSFPSPFAVRAGDRALALLTHNLFAVSDAIRRQLADTEGISRDRIAVAYNGVDGARFDPGADPVAARTALDLPEAPTVGIVGRLSPEKNHALLFRALVRVPEARLVVVGGGPMEQEVRAAAEQAGVIGRVTFTGPRDDVPRLLAAMDVLVLCSTTEGFPLAPIEGLAAGRPVIITDVGGCREILAGADVGRLIPSGDEEALAAEIRALLNDDALRRRMGAAARAHFEARFSLERMVAVYQAAYEGGRPCAE